MALEASVLFLKWQLVFTLLPRLSVSYETRVQQNTDRATLRYTSGTKRETVIIDKYLPFQEFIKKPKWRIVSNDSQVGKGEFS